MLASIRLSALGLSLPEVTAPRYSYLPVSRCGRLLFVSGQTPRVDGRLTATGHVGAEVDIAGGIEAARIGVLNSLAQLGDELGSIDRVERIVRLTGYVASAPGFGGQADVIEGASTLLLDVFGDAGRHARSAIGVAELPGGAPVEIELIVAAD